MIKKIKWLWKNNEISTTNLYANIIHQSIAADIDWRMMMASFFQKPKSDRWAWLRNLDLPAKIKPCQLNRAARLNRLL